MTNGLIFFFTRLGLARAGAASSAPLISSHRLMRTFDSMIPSPIPWCMRHSMSQRWRVRGGDGGN
jgi:hypothetical protein